MHSCHSCSSIVHRALVTYANESTGEIRIKIPSLLGVGSEVSISYIGRNATNNVWAVPTAGDQIVVTADDANLTNIFWVQTSPFNPSATEYTGLASLSDVTLTTPASEEILAYNGAQWVNNSALLSAKAPLNSPTFTGTVSGISKSMVGLGNVDNTSDTNKPVSTAQQTALNAKANLSGATFTGGVSVTGGYLDGGYGVTCNGGVSLGSGSAISSFQNYRALQIATATAWGGIYDNHSGYLINAQMPAGWTSALLQFRTSSDWSTYNSYTIAFQYGNVYGNGWSQSDARTKINVVDNPYGLDIVRQMSPKRFGYRMPDNTVNDHVSLTNQKVGFIAQELMEVLPDAVFHRDYEEENEHGYSAAYSVDYGSITAVLTKAIQELDARLTTIEEA